MSTPVIWVVSGFLTRNPIQMNSQFIAKLNGNATNKVATLVCRWRCGSAGFPA